MDNDLIALYLYGLLVYWIAYIEDFRSPADIFVSFVIATTWPILMPVRIVQLYAMKD